MNLYFTHLASHNAPKNRIEKEVLAVLKAESNQLVENVPAFVESVTRQIEAINAQFPRCTPLTVSTYGFDGTENLYLGGKYTVSFTIHPVKNSGRFPEVKS